MWKLFGGLYLGWGIGANDSAKIFAPAIATNTIRYRTAILFICVFVMAGAILQGYTLYDGYKFGGGSPDTATLLKEATIATNAAAFAVMVATIFGIPVSSSQAAVGALIGVAAVRLGWGGLDYAPIVKMLVCWVVTPLAGALIAYGCFLVLRVMMRRLLRDMNMQQRFLRYGIIIIGCYEAFALGANNVVVTTAPFYQAGLFGPPGPEAVEAQEVAAALGAAAIAIGAMTFAKRVIETFGRKVTVLDPFSAFVVAIATGTTMEVFTLLKVPVSITQAGVGALVGVGLTQGAGGISLPMLRRIVGAWFISPLVAGGLAYAAACLLA